MNKNQDKGFTLVELLIVIVILGILATVTVFAVRGITDRGQENACSVDQRTLDTAIESYYASYQQDPVDEDALVLGHVTDATTNPVTRDEPLLKSAPSNFSFFAAGANNVPTPGADGSMSATADNGTTTAATAVYVAEPTSDCAS